MGGAVEEKLEGGEKTVGGVGEIRGGLDGKVRTVRGKTNERKGTEERDNAKWRRVGNVEEWKREIIEKCQCK